MQEMQIQSLGQVDPLVTHSSILAWRIPWTEKPGGLQSMGSQSQTRQHTHVHIAFQVIIIFGCVVLPVES